MRDYEYIMAIDDNGQPYLAHALTKESGQVRYTSGRRGASTKGSQRQNHKYYTRVEDRGRWRYFYSPEEFRAWSTGARQAVGNKVNQATSAARGVANRIGDRASEAASSLRSRATNAYREATGLAARDRMNVSQENLGRANRVLSSAEKRTDQAMNRNTNAASAARQAQFDADSAQERADNSNIFTRRKNRAAAEAAAETAREAESSRSRTEAEFSRAEKAEVTARKNKRDAEANYNSDREAYERSLAGRAESARNKASEAVDTARTKASEARDTIRDKVSDAKEVASDRAEKASNALRDRSERMKSDLRKLTNKAGDALDKVGNTIDDAIDKATGQDVKDRATAAKKAYDDANGEWESTYQSALKTLDSLEFARDRYKRDPSKQNERLLDRAEKRMDEAQSKLDDATQKSGDAMNELMRARNAYKESKRYDIDQAVEKAGSAIKSAAKAIDDRIDNIYETSNTVPVGIGLYEAGKSVARAATDPKIREGLKQVGNELKGAALEKFRDAKASADDLMKGTKLYKEWRDNPSLETFSALNGNKTATAIRDARNKIMDSMDQAVLKATSGMKGAEIHEQYKKASEAYRKDPTPENAKRADDLYDKWLDSPHGRLINNDFISNAQSNGLRTAVSDAAENAKDSVRSAAGRVREAASNAADNARDTYREATGLAARDRRDSASQDAQRAYDQLSDARKREQAAADRMTQSGRDYYEAQNDYNEAADNRNLFNLRRSRKAMNEASERAADAAERNQKAEASYERARTNTSKAETAFDDAVERMVSTRDDYDRTLAGHVDRAREAVGNAASSARDAANRAVELTQSQANRLQKKLNEGKELTQQEMNSLISFFRSGEK